MGRRVIAITAAVLLAIVGVVAVVLYANGADQRAIASAQPRTVFVSAQAVPAGTTLNDAIAGGLIVETTLPAKSVPAGSLTAVTDENKNLLALSEIAPGEYIQSARFGTTPQGSQAIRVPNGQIAMSLNLSDPARVGTFVAPGSHIVLYDTIAGATATGGCCRCRRGTHVLFDDVLVIAIGSHGTDARPADWSGHGRPAGRHAGHPRPHAGAGPPTRPRPPERHPVRRSARLGRQDRHCPRCH